MYGEKHTKVKHKTILNMPLHGALQIKLLQYMGKTDLTWEISSICYQSNLSRIMRNKTTSEELLPIFLLPGLTLLLNSLRPPLQWCRASRNGGCYQFITRRLCCSFLLREGILTLLPLEGLLHIL